MKKKNLIYKKFLNVNLKNKHLMKTNQNKFNNKNKNITSYDYIKKNKLKNKK